MSKKVIVPKKGQLRFTSRMRLLPYDDMEQLLRKGNEVFIEGIKRQTAHSAAKTLTKKLGFEVKAYASTCDFVDDKKSVTLKGYGFLRVNNQDEKKK